jgi:NAD(P)-dependent dehydrogenase (short-subunit alcohol dehydrogenase family)
MTTSYDFSDKVVSITGAASGFGRLAAERFSEAGARLVLSDIDGAALQVVAEELGAGADRLLAVTCDVSNDADVAYMFDQAEERFGGVDIAINNAGIIHDLVRTSDISEETFDRNIAVNLKGTFLCMRHELRQMAAKGSGKIINMASASGLIGSPFLSVYAAAKHGVVGLTRSAAVEYGRKGIQVNALCPAFSSTPMLEAVVAERGEKVLDGIVGAIPMQRLAEPEEIVSAILWLSSDDNSFMNGAAVSVDGGLVAG